MASAASRIDIQVAIDGLEVSGLCRASVSTTNSFSADTYSLTFAMSSETPNSPAFWSSIKSGCVSVTATVASLFGSLTQDLITGMIDTIYVNPIQGIVCIEGRDLSASMVDSYRQQDFVNQTASEIVATIAHYHNLQPVLKATTENVGRYYSDGYTRLSLGQFSRLQSDWDIVVQLARQNNFDAFIRGTNFYFQPASDLDDTPRRVGLHEVQNARIERALNIGSNATAAVQSWNSQSMSATSSNIPRDAADANAGPPADAPYLFSGSNYGSEQANNLAGRYTAELGRLRTVLELNMPWDLALSPRMLILLTETNSSFESIYKIESIERHYSTTSGSTQALRAAEITTA